MLETRTIFLVPLKFSRTPIRQNESRPSEISTDERESFFSHLPLRHCSSSSASFSSSSGGGSFSSGGGRPLTSRKGEDSQERAFQQAPPQQPQPRPPPPPPQSQPQSPPRKPRVHHIKIHREDLECRQVGNSQVNSFIVISCGKLEVFTITFSCFFRRSK